MQYFPTRLGQSRDLPHTVCTDHGEGHAAKHSASNPYIRPGNKDH